MRAELSGIPSTGRRGLRRPSSGAGGAVPSLPARRLISIIQAWTERKRAGAKPASGAFSNSPAPSVPPKDPDKAGGSGLPARRA